MLLLFICSPFKTQHYWQHSLALITTHAKAR
jgi:hypothetical protein